MPQDNIIFCHSQRQHSQSTLKGSVISPLYGIKNCCKGPVSISGVVRDYLFNISFRPSLFFTDQPYFYSFLTKKQIKQNNNNNKNNVINPWHSGNRTH